MKKLKPLSSKKPPLPNEDHQLIQEWIKDVKPSLNPVVSKLDDLIREHLPNPRYEIKWGKAYYGDEKQGWCIELVAYDVSVNVVFLNGDCLDSPPELGDETRYIKIKDVADSEFSSIKKWVKQSCSLKGWSW